MKPTFKFFLIFSENRNSFDICRYLCYYKDKFRKR